MTKRIFLRSMSPLSLSVWSTPLLAAFVFAATPTRDANAAPTGGEKGQETQDDAEAPSSGVDESQAASQVASFALTKLKDSPAVVTVMTGDDIRAMGARDLIDVLHQVPGFFIGADVEGIVGPGFRGLWGHEGKILLLIDGKEMNELFYSNMQLGNEFPVEFIERVEVVRGPGSVIYGGIAELAVINVVTRGLQGATDVMVTGTYGQMTEASHADTGYARRKISASARMVFDSVPGLSSFASVSIGQGQRSARDYVDNSGAVASMENHSALDPIVVQAGVGYRDLQASILFHHLSTTDVDGYGAVISPPVKATFDSFHGDLVWTLRPSNRLEIVPRFNFVSQTPWHIAEGPLQWEKSVRRVRGRLLGRWAATDWLQVTAGGDAIYDYAKVDGPLGAGVQTGLGTADGTSVDYQTFGGFVEFFSENPIVNIAAGARYDNLSTIGGALVPRFVLLRSFGPVSLKGLFSHSFRTPGIENINSSVGLTPITPERTQVFEFEGSVDVTPQQRLSANAFDVSIESPIAYTLDPVTNADRYLNLGRQASRGFELSYRLRTKSVKVDASYSFYAPSAAKNVPTYTVPGHTEQFLGAAAHRGAFRATFRPSDSWGISPSATIVGPQFARGTPGTTADETALEIPAQFLANLFIFADNVGTKGLTLGFGIYNIFGSDFRYTHPYASTAPDATPMAVSETYAADHAPLPGLDREVMIRASYLFEP